MKKEEKVKCDCNCGTVIATSSFTEFAESM